MREKVGLAPTFVVTFVPVRKNLETAEGMGAD
jgi:hypothetical protein